MLNNQGRPTQPVPTERAGAPATISGDRGLDHEEGLIFEIGRTDTTGVDLPDIALADDRLGGLMRKSIGLPGLSEPETMRHYVRLSQRNASIDASLYPLGSCTMKHNPRLNEKMARLPGFADIHPLQPRKTVQGALALIAELARWLTELTGMPAVAMSPKAGAHGELCGLLVEEEGHGAFVANVLEGHAAEMEGVLLLSRGRGVLGLGDDPLDEGTERLGLGQRGLDATVLDEGGTHVGEHRLAVLAGDAEGGVVFIVTHDGNL